MRSHCSYGKQFGIVGRDSIFQVVLIWCTFLFYDFNQLLLANTDH